MRKILILHGPNLNLLGQREVSIYGKKTLNQINSKIKKLGKEKKLEVECFQSNSEAELIKKIHSAKDNLDGIIINPGAFTHYSYAIRDALEALKIPKIEVHISNIFAREEWRKKSVISPVVNGVISGFGANSYLLALEAILNLLKK